ncbi:MAG: UDP-N-acetylmuramoyl-L-alanyl-D-glutamate--2,6-diaminopimelate ligase, partial [Candidatus Omnitrophica bacterium]|nr:UDP-N-acetylmuramoyl-L-alanyl-D-glutamate--2,6-diaminopimelate ligase [Candidatus Omnitrophota bacterium]
MRVKGINCDSRRVAGDFIFVAIKGNKEDGHRFIKEAINKGARVIVTQGRYPLAKSSKGISFIEVADTRKALAELAASFYGRPSEKLKVVGITGTNGKTTISYLIEAILKEAHFNPGVIGTINYRFKNRVFAARNTTPGPLELQPMLARMRKEKVKYAVMEVSSHALEQERIAGISFHSAVFTNLTQDHLDYHLTLENYFRAKAKLFRGLKRDSFCVLNNDDTYGRRLKKLTKAGIITYGIGKGADIIAADIKLGVSQAEFTVKTKRGNLAVRTGLIGCHNVYNVLASVSWALKEGIKQQVIKSAVEKFCFVPGRLEKIACSQGFSVFVDYAHTEDALKNVITFLRQISIGRIIVVFGCGGERDKTKRPRMGRVVTTLADYAIITNDNPRSESPGKIVSAIRRGISKDNYRVILDRKRAIEQALSIAG